MCTKSLICVQRFCRIIQTGSTVSTVPCSKNRLICVYVGQCDELRLEREEVSRKLGASEESCKGQAVELSVLKQDLASSQVLIKQVQERCEQLEENRTLVTRESLLSESDVRHSPIFLGKS